MVNISVWIKQI